MKKYFFGILFLILTYSCAEDKDSIIGQIDIPGETQTSFKFSAEGGDEEFSFSSTLGWKATTNADWIQFSPAYGKAGESTLKISVSPSDEIRSATIIIDNSEASKEIQILQSKYPDKSNFDVYATELTLEKYANEKFEWHLVMKDEKYIQSYGSEGRSVYLKFFVDKSHDYSKGIPFGQYKIEQSENAGTSLGVIIEGREESLVNGGFVEIQKINDQVHIGLMVDAEGKDQVVTNYHPHPDFLHVFNYAYGSNISRDLTIDNYDQAYIMDEGDIFREGKKIWRLNIGQKDIQFKYVGLHEGVGEWLEITLVTALDVVSPVGTYEFVMDDRTLIENTALGGYRSNMMGGIGFNSWWRSQIAPNEFVEETPFVAGKVEVKQNTDGTYSIDVLAVDDALPENNTLLVKYNGKMDIYDPTKTGDFAMANADFYGPFEFNSPNMNWFIGLGDKSLSDTYWGEGEAWVFDIMARPDQKFTTGSPYGVYRIVDNTNYEAGTIHMAYHRTYQNYTLKEEVKLVSGQIEMKLLADGREEIIVDAVDAKGNVHKGKYTGTIPKNSLSTPPYADRVFNPADAVVTANFFGRNYAPGNEKPEKVGWDLILEDKDFYNSKGQNGLAIELELRTTVTQSVEDGLPVGVFPIYEPHETGVKEGIYNGDFTLYTVAYETAQSKVMITGGYITIARSGDNYTIDLELETANEHVRFTVTGSYNGKLVMNDFSGSTFSANDKRVAKTSQKSAGEQKKIQFKK